jgi:hypothetical protein
MLHVSSHDASERKALRRRVRRLYEWFNRGLWEKCFSLVDPQLKAQSKVQLPTYAERMQAFQGVYGTITLWHVRIGLHLDGSSNKQDPRPFAYVYVIWQGKAHGFHMFRERWVKHADGWFTRVVGLVPNRQELLQGQD